MHILNVDILYNTVPADVWCRNYIQPWADICITCAAYVEYGQCCACCWSGAQWHLIHQQTWYGNYILYAESYHVLNEWSKFSSGWGMIYNQCGVCWWSDSGLHSIMGRRSMEICILYPELCHVLGAWLILPYALCSWAMTNAVSALAGILTAPDHCQMQHDKCVCVLSCIIYLVSNLCLYPCCMHEEW